MSKSMKKLLIILTLNFYGLTLAAEDILTKKQESIFTEDPWEFLETHFIKNPQLKASAIDKICQKFLISAIPSLSVWGLSLLISCVYVSATARETLNAARIPDDPIEKATFRICSALGSIVCLLPTYYSTKFVYNKAHNYILSKIEEADLKTFIENWPDNKNITPEQFHEDFEKLYIEFKKSDTILDIKKINLILKKRIIKNLGSY